MKKGLLALGLIFSCVATAVAQSYTEDFNANSLGWTECAYESNNGTAIIDKGVLTIESKGEKKGLSVALTMMSGKATKVGENTFFEAHCYAPLNVKRAFEIKTHVNIKKLDNDQTCGIVFNYKDGGTFYCFTFNDEQISFLRYVDNAMVGSISQGIKWGKKKKLDQEWKLISDGETLSFFVDDLEVMKVRYMPLEYAGFGYYTFGKQTLKVDDVTFTQN